MRLQILSDLHMEAGDYRPEKTDADVVILAGDINVGCGGIQWANKNTSPSSPSFMSWETTSSTGVRLPGCSRNLEPQRKVGMFVCWENESVQIGNGAPEDRRACARDGHFYTEGIQSPRNRACPHKRGRPTRRNFWCRDNNCRCNGGTNYHAFTKM
jgi:hypothetical protein